MNINLSDYNQVVFDFDGVFTNNKLLLDQNGIEYIVVSRSDGYAINLLKMAKLKKFHNLDFFVLSTEKNPIVKFRCEKMKLECVSGVSNKLEYLTSRIQLSGLEVDEGLRKTIYLGNDLNDLSVMRRVGLAIAPADAHYRIKEIGSIIGKNKGGQDFVREIVEMMLGFGGMSVEEIDEFISNS